MKTNLFILLKITSTAEYAIIIGLSITVCVIYFVFIHLIQRIKNNKKLEQQADSHLVNLLKAQTEIQEQTFQNISTDIHDNIGQKLSLAKLQVVTAQTSPSVDLKITEKLITDAISDLRDLSRTLSSDIVVREGFVQAIREETEMLVKTCRLEIIVRVTGFPVFLPDMTETLLYRIYQEGIQNIIKHANAKRVVITIHFDTQWLTMTIADDGKGLPAELNEGSGFANMKKRAKSMNGTALIKSDAEGTKLIIQIPITNDAEN